MEMYKLARLTESQIDNAIVFLRRRRLLMNENRMAFSGTSFTQLNDQVNRNSSEFLESLMAGLTREEFEILMT